MRTENGARVGLAGPGQWATVNREWKQGDSVEIAIPMRFRFWSTTTPRTNCRFSAAKSCSTTLMATKLCCGG